MTRLRLHFVFALVTCLLRGYSGFEENPLVEKFAWKSLDYQFDEEWMGEAARAQRLFRPENNLPVGLEIWHEKMFITVPRWREGVPSTLNYVLLGDERRSPPLSPYPDWATNRQGDCDAITTTYRVRADACDRLWVLDSGAIGLTNTTQQLCPWSIHVFDLKTNRRLRKYNLHKGDTNANSFVPNLVVDVHADACDDAFAYAADALGYGLIVYSWRANDSWRFEHGFLMPDPLVGEYTVGNVSFQWANEGVFGLALTPLQWDGNRLLVFHPLSSHRDFYVSTEVLRNKTRVNNSYGEWRALPSRGAGGHVSTHVVDDATGVLLYALVDRDAIACWDSQKPYAPRNLLTVARDRDRLVFPSDTRIDRDRTLWVMSDRMPVHLFAGLDYADFNFRVMHAPVDALVAGTVCDPAVSDKDVDDKLSVE